MTTFFEKINLLLWGGPMLLLLFSCHVYFTIRSHFVQRHLGCAFRLLRRTDGHSAIGALTTTLAATLGTGNIIGMSVAVSLGGPGAVFWCWLTGIFGMATTYTECNLSLLHRHETDSAYGPMHLLAHHLNRPRIATTYAIGLLVCSLLTSGLTQSNALSSSASALLHRSHTFDSHTVLFLIGALTALLLLLIFQGHLHGIHGLCAILVPAMSAFFLLGIALLLVLHIREVPDALRLIFTSAFRLRPISGGLLGYSLGNALRQGVAKGLFTNEAGLGTAPLAALTNSKDTPTEQSLISMFATFFDTVFLCGITGVTLIACILTSPVAYLGLPGEQWLTVAFSSLPLFGDTMLHLCIITFAFATLIGWSFFGEKAAAYLAGSTGVVYYRLLYLIVVIFGACTDTAFAWELADFGNLFLLLPNLYLLLRMRRSAIYPTDHHSVR